jgi:SAP domain
MTIKTWSKVKVADLKAGLLSRGLKATGKKAELVALLKESNRTAPPIDDDFAAFAVDDIDFDADELSKTEPMQLEKNPVAFDDNNDDSMLLEDPGEDSDVDSMTVQELKTELKIHKE